jgi:hypothetical protein
MGWTRIKRDGKTVWRYEGPGIAYVDPEDGDQANAAMEARASLRRLYRAVGKAYFLELLANAVRPRDGAENLQPRDRREETGGSDTASGDGNVRRGVL